MLLVESLSKEITFFMLLFLSWVLNFFYFITREYIKVHMVLTPLCH